MSKELSDKEILVKFAAAIRNGIVNEDDLIRLAISAMPQNYEAEKHTNLIRIIMKKYTWWQYE